MLLMMCTYEDFWTKPVHNVCLIGDETKYTQIILNRS